MGILMVEKGVVGGNVVEMLIGIELEKEKVVFVLLMVVKKEELI